MNATKRKFNALVQGIGARSSPAKSNPSCSQQDDVGLLLTSSHLDSSSSVNMAPDSELISKRRRLAPSDRANPTSPTTISNVVLRKWSPHTSANASSHGPAKYCPSDRPELLRRLATFQELTDWTPKPDRVSEIEWAKRGWVCQGSERVRCTLCNKELVVKLNKKEVDGKEVSVLVPSDIGMRDPMSHAHRGVHA
jgi:hypothetical protein